MSDGSYNYTKAIIVVIQLYVVATIYRELSTNASDRGRPVADRDDRRRRELVALSLDRYLLCWFGPRPSTSGTSWCLSCWCVIIWQTRHLLKPCQIITVGYLRQESRLRSWITYCIIQRTHLGNSITHLITRTAVARADWSPPIFHSVLFRQRVILSENISGVDRILKCEFKYAQATRIETNSELLGANTLSWWQWVCCTP